MNEEASKRSRSPLKTILRRKEKRDTEFFLVFIYITRRIKYVTSKKRNMYIHFRDEQTKMKNKNRGTL